ncbi:MAG: sigma-70 family RNA polymerase sigma factor [Clostridiales bacterium]|nr:sigma-70 family RNA polymerase sigma factor [Clostridiales bacterium]
MDYQLLTDEELAGIAKNDKSKPFEVLLERYDKNVRAIVNKYFCLDADRDDLRQVGLLALSSAVDGYNEQGSFQAYACACINNAVLSALRSNNRKKNEPLRNYIPLSGYGDGDTDKTEVLVDFNVGPEDFLIDNEKKNETEKLIKDTLSELEYKIFALSIQGYSYEEIGNKIDKSGKSVDNALQRIRRKLRLKLNVNKEI